MKRLALRLLCLLIAVMPLTAAAQTNIKAAFEAIIKCPQAQITETHNLDKDPETNIKTGQCDVYRFVLPADKIKLIKKVNEAFTKDNDKAYSINSGKRVSTDNEIHLAVGDATGRGEYINEADCEYMYALFIPSQAEDKDGKYRYAYGINYKEENGNLVGKLVITYATTLKYRQQLEQEKQAERWSSFPNGVTVMTPQQKSWFDTVMSYFQGMTSADSQTRIALATKAYNMIQKTPKYPEVTDREKNTVREIIKGMISDKKYSETILNNLLTQCLVTLK